MGLIVAAHCLRPFDFNEEAYYSPSLETGFFRSAAYVALPIDRLQLRSATYTALLFWLLELTFN